MIVLLLACSSFIPTERESLELLALTDNGDIFEVRFTKGDTGIFKGQGHVRVHRWIREQTPMSYILNTSPADTNIDATSARFGPLKLYKNNNSWSLYIRSEELNASATFAITTTPVTKTEKDWTVEVLEQNGDFRGWASAQQRSAPINARATLVHRHGTGILTDPKETLIMFGKNFHLGIEKQGDLELIWGEWQGESLADINFEYQDSQHGRQINASNWAVNFYATHHLGSDDSFEHIFAMEKWASSKLISTYQRDVFQGYAKIKRGDEELTANAFFIYQGDDPPSIQPPRKR